jgi:cathepsin F
MKILFTIILSLIAFSKQTFFEDKQISNKFTLSKSEIELNAFNLFQKFIEDQGKSYTTIEEYKQRFSIFKENLYRIKSIQENDPDAEYNVNVFADLSQEEFFKTNLMQDLNEEIKSGNDSNNLKFLEYETSKLSVQDLPKNWDWREKKVVSKVKNQGMCGSCWAFSAVQAAESHYAIKTGKLYDLAEQQLLDCDRIDHACGGGLHYRGLDYIGKNGLVEDKNYPYKKKRSNCTINHTDVVAKFSGYKNITSDEIEMQKTLYELGPISVGMDATTLQFYIGGVANPWLCSQTNNHAVLIVGYGHSIFGKDYWLIKNSWGAWWGERGYFKLVRGKKICGITKAPAVPIV